MEETNHMDDAESIQQMIEKNKKKYEKEDTRLTGKYDILKEVPKNEQPRLNEKLIEMLEKMSTLMQKKGDNIRSRIYSRAQDTVLSINEDITEVDQMKGRPHIGPTILSKMEEYVKTGTLTEFEKEKNNPLTWLTDVYGIGPKKAADLIEKGIRKIEDLREQQEELLNKVQKIGLKYYEDINMRIPRSEIDEFKDVFDKEFQKVAEKDSQSEIVGSYRRGAKDSGDIDVIITSKNPEVFKKYVDSLKETGIILEILSYGNTKALVIAKLKDKTIARRVDFLYTTPEEYPFAVLYFTGSKAFNTTMRGYALKLGISLNEHGMYEKEKGKEKGDKIEKVFKTEEDIFKKLHLQYKLPIDRIDGRSLETTLPIIDDSKTEKDNPECYDSCETVPGGLCANGCSPSWTNKRLIGSRNWCHCNIDKTDCDAHICNKEEKEAKQMRGEDKVSKKKRTTKKKSPKKDEKPKRKYTKKKKIDPIMLETKKEEKEDHIDKVDDELPELIPIIKQDTMVKIPKKTTLKKKVQTSPKKMVVKTRKKKIILKDKDMKSTMDKEKAKKTILEFKKEGIDVIANLNESDLENLILVADDQYYNTKNPIATDSEYDIIIEFMQRKYPKNEVLNNIGAKVEKNKVELPYEMASMDKIKPDSNALSNWKVKYKGDYVLSCKLDGVSGLYTTEGDTPKLYTRGNGKVGQDITHLLKVLKLPKTANYVVRGEFIIPKQVFDNKYKSRFANPRNLVSGIINSKTIDEKAQDVHFVAYEVIKPEMKSSEQMAKLAELGHNVVMNETIPDITNESLSSTLIDWRTNYEYEIDGVIVSNNKLHPRQSGNPKHAFAFKMVISDQVAEAKVLDVIWTPSKDGYLKPRVRIEPIRLGGVTIEYATGFNGKFIEDNKIGIGAVIQIIRSGDVIPYIKSITAPAETTKMPDVEYHWNETHIDIILENADTDTVVVEKNITAFFTTIGVDGLSSGNVKRIMNAGFDSIVKILHMTKKDFEEVDGFKEKMINKIYDGIQNKIEKASLIDIMVASNLFGRGIGMKKITPIMKAQPNVLVDKITNQKKKELLMEINGIGNENANSFVDNIPQFLEFLKEAKLMHKLEIQKDAAKENEIQNEIKQLNHPLTGMHIVMTKVRDKYIIEELKKVGGILDDNIGKQTNVLITKSYEDVSKKTEKAREMNIPIMIPADFVKKYDL